MTLSPDAPSIDRSPHEHERQLDLIERTTGLASWETDLVTDRIHWSCEQCHIHLLRGIVEAHGGELDAVSTPGEGATFRFRIPLDRA